MGSFGDPIFEYGCGARAMQHTIAFEIFVVYRVYYLAAERIVCVCVGFVGRVKAIMVMFGDEAATPKK